MKTDDFMTELPAYGSLGGYKIKIDECTRIEGDFPTFQIKGEILGHAQRAPGEFFQVGDEVYHRADGRKAIVVRQKTRCLNPDHKGMSCFFVGDCIEESIDVYDISTGFCQLIETVDGFLLTKNPPLKGGQG